MRALTGLSGLSGVCGLPSQTRGASGGDGWDGSDRLTASDDEYATALVSPPGSSDALSASGFGFALPAGATVRGARVDVERSRQGAGTAALTTLELLVAGSPAGGAKTDSSDWPLSDAVAGYGHAADLWGATLSAADVNDDNFGVRLAVDAGGTGDVTFRVDCVRMTVWYS